MAGSGGTLTWSTTSVTLAVGETITVNYTTTFNEVQSNNFAPLIASVATFTEGTNKIDLTGTAAGTVTIAANTTVGFETVTTNALTITVTSADDQNFLNERGLAHFWENVDDVKQNKLTAGAGISITNDVISATGGGTADAVDWGNITGSMSNQTDLTTALNAKANTADLATVATSGDYDDLTDKPTIGNATLTVQKNGTSAGTFTANATSNKTINITVPTTAADVSALPASTKYGASIAVSVNTTDYKVTTTLKDQDGNTLGTAQVIDLPLESVVVNGSYDNTNKKIILTLQNGNTIDIPVADLVAGLQSEITSNNKLSSDLVDDTNHTHKFVTAAQITKLNGIASGAEVNVQSDWDQTTTTADDYIKNKPSLATVATSGSYNDLSNKPTIPAAQVNSDWNATSGKAQILNKPTLATVATSGSYNDLSNKPAIPAAQVQSNWTQTTTTAVDYIKNKPALATVATSGSYNDLSNKPTIPDKQVFYGTSDSSGSSSSKTVACSGFTYAEGNVIYVTFSDADTYSGDSGMTMNVNSTGEKVIFTQTASGGGVQSDHKWAAGETVCFVCHNDRYLMVEAAMATTTTSGLMSVNDKNKLDGIAAGAEVNVQANWTESDSSSDAYIQNKPTLATVATSGSYNDLLDRPTLSDEVFFINAISFSGSDGSYAVTVDKTYSEIMSAYQGDKVLIVRADVNSVPDSGYPASSTDYVYAELYHVQRNEAIEGAPTSFFFATGGTSGNGRSITAHSHIFVIDEQSARYNRYFGSITVTDVVSNVTNPVSSNAVYSALAAKANSADLATVATSGSYNDLSNRPTIPTVNNATLTIQKNGTTVNTFTANASSNATANITVPTAVSELTNDSGYLEDTSTISNATIDAILGGA